MPYLIVDRDRPHAHGEIVLPNLGRVQVGEPISGVSGDMLRAEVNAVFGDQYLVIETTGKKAKQPSSKASRKAIRRF
jgi:hypothetical protein